MDPYDKTRIFGGYFYNLFKCRFQSDDVIDFFTDKVAACHIWIKGCGFKYFKILLKVVGWCHGIFDNCKRYPTHGSKKSYHDASFLIYFGHDFMYLSEHLYGLIFFNKCRITYLSIYYSLFLIISGNPQ